MNATASPYRILSRVHVTKWVDDLQEAVEGRDLKALWLSTGTTLRIFVPDKVYSAENVDKLLRAEGAEDERIHALSG
ncbi:MAG: hypothetical protein DMD33_00860 [Gemmatimonadetes bacterium]|nr:MAG: hypothetical protein DMD33_00860 [Gemmatimonadota bacterium]